jgi:hypothetical protein
MPLSVFKLSRSALQLIADKMAGRIPAWKAKLLHRNGRLTLIKTTLAAIPVYTTIIIELPPCLCKSMESIMKGFVWASSKTVQGGKCLVPWARVQRLQRTDPTRSWAGLPCHVDPVTEAFFKASITCFAGNSENTFFWSDP